MLKLWRDHFNSLLKGDFNTEAAAFEIPFTDGGVHISPLVYDEDCIAIKRRKNNKAPGADGRTNKMHAYAPVQNMIRRKHAQ